MVCIGASGCLAGLAGATVAAGTGFDSAGLDSLSGADVLTGAALASAVCDGGGVT